MTELPLPAAWPTAQKLRPLLPLQLPECGAPDTEYACLTCSLQNPPWMLDKDWLLASAPSTLPLWSSGRVSLQAGREFRLEILKASYFSKKKKKFSLDLEDLGGPWNIPDLILHSTLLPLELIRLHVHGSVPKPGPRPTGFLGAGMAYPLVPKHPPRTPRKGTLASACPASEWLGWAL